MAIIALTNGETTKEALNRKLSNTHTATKGPAINGTINVWIHAHTHNDPGWLVTADQYYVKQVRYILDTVIGALATNPQRKFTYVEQGFFQRWWKEQNDASKALVHKLVENGQFEFNLGGWSMADEACTTYEDVINEMTLGAKFIYDEFGVRPTVGWSIDPFGHSREIEAMYADIGFDAFGINRVHYADKEKRKQDKKMEFVWRGSNSQGEKSDMFIHMMDNHYCSPSECDFFSNSSGDCMYRKSDGDWFQDDADLPTFKVNAEEKAQAFVKMVKERANYYDNGNNLLITWGCDFTFLSAPVSYANMDKLIKYVNENEERFGVHVQYSVFSDYIKAVHKADKEWDVYHDDFMPYASDPDAYWVGYYTSRGRTKGLNRRGLNELAAAELYLSLAKMYSIGAERQAVFDKIMKLRKALGEFQHHDAITGTEKQAVADDYNVQLEDGSFFANEATSMILGAMLQIDVNRNITIKLEEMKEGQKLGVIAVNNNGWVIKNVIRMILQTNAVHVVNNKGEELPYQINDIPDWSIERANGTHVCYVEVEVPALGFTTLYVEKKKDRSAYSHGYVSNDDMIENDYYQLFYTNGKVSKVLLKKEGREIPFTDALYQYTGRCGNYRCSGAYSFSTDDTAPASCGDSVKLEIVKGALLEEARITYREGYHQIVRLYYGNNDMTKVMEYVHDMGPTDSGREIVVRYASELLKSKRVMYTDGNGLEDIKRVFREDSSMPIPANYYPISNRAHMMNEETDLRLNIIVDRPHGVATVEDGVFEIMLKRRTVSDDGFGVDEALREDDHYQQTHWITLGSLKTSVDSAKQLDFNLNHAPIPFYFVSDKAIDKADYTMLKKPFPRNVQLLNLQVNQLADDDYLLRFHHVYTKGEQSELAEEVSFDVNEYFEVLKVKEMKEMTLSGMFTREQVNKERLQWKIKEGRTATHVRTDTGTVIHLTPMEFKTYRVKI